MRTGRQPQSMRSSDAGSFGDRLSGAFVSLLLSVPIAALLWLEWPWTVGAGMSMGITPGRLVLGVIALFVFGFVFPRVIPAVFGAILKLFSFWRGW